MCAQDNIKQIFLHFNKSTYISGENIYYSSYLFKKDSKKLHLPKEYIYINLLDENGNSIDSRITQSDNGLGSGSFFLSKEMESGQYYIQAHTYDMNFLNQDHSSIYPISLINMDSGLLPLLTASSQINIEFFPEGGNLIEGIFNSCVVQIRDAYNMPLQLDSLILSNDKDLKGQRITINKKGLGKFSLIPENDIDFMVTAHYGDKTVKVPVLKAKPKGYVLMANTNHEKQEIGISIRTNQVTHSKMNQTYFSLHIKGGDALEILEIPIDLVKVKKEIILPYANLQQGFNTISLLDSNNSILASRKVFILKDRHTTLPQITNVKRENDSLTIHIKTALGEEENFKPGISLSVLPEESTSQSTLLSINTNNSQNEILLAPNLIRNPNTKLSKEQLYLTDLSLLAEPVKDNYHQTENSFPNHNLSTVDGYVNLFGTKNDSLTVLLYSYENRLFETSPLGTDDKFQFNNIPLKNKSSIALTVLNKKGESIYANFFFTVQPYSKKYKYSYSPTIHQKDAIRLEPIEQILSPISNEIKLDEVEVVENKLKYDKFFGDFNGRKVDSTMLNFNTLGNYMRSFGYNVTFVSPYDIDPKRAASTQLYKVCRDPRYQNPQILYPSLVFNGTSTGYVMDYENVRMELIDEIYFLKRARCDPGLFVVFTNDKYAKTRLAERDKNSKEFTVDQGYDGPSNFVRPSYTDFDTVGYQKWGVIGWFPHLKPDKNGIIIFKIPNDHQKNLSLQMVGTTMDGTLFNQNIFCTVSD